MSQIDTNSTDKNKPKKTFKDIYGFHMEKVIYNLLKNEPFYANFCMNTKVVLNRPDVPTAATTIRRGEIILFFNTDFMGSMPVISQSDVLKHEVKHLLFDHCGRRGKQFGNLNHHIKNIAMDCAINQGLQHLPKNPDGTSDFVTLEGLRQQTKLDLEPNQPWEYYYINLMKYAEENGKIEYVVDNHDMMEESSDEGAGEDAINRASIQDALSKAVKASAGNVPKDIVTLLAALGKAKLPWKQILRNFVANARSINRIPTRQKPHRRFELDQPGKKKERKLILGVCADSSGSVSDEAYAMFMAEISAISKQTNITYLVHADCEVRKVEVIRGGKPKKGALGERHGNGGTAYQPAISKCKQLGCDAIIYFGDLDSADKPDNPGVPFLWVRVGKQDPPGNFGKILDLD